MKSLIRQYRPVLKFVLVFFGSYAVLAALYGIFLGVSNSGPARPDAITQLVARQTGAVMQSFGYSTDLIVSSTRPAINMIIEGRHLVNVVEGCNAVSVIILFTAFVLSFARGFWSTAVFVFAGATLIYSVNILRIALLTVAIYHYPDLNGFFHDILFPLIIYGLVFGLWVIWTRQLLIKKKNDQSA